MSVEKVKQFFRDRGMAERILEFTLSSATVELAARALNCKACRIAKTLSFRVENRVILIVSAGDTKIDNGKYKSHFGKKAKMLSHDETEPLVGYAVGGICPFAVNEGVDIYLDRSLKRFETVFPACGSANSAIELSIPELEKCTDCKGWVDVCRIIG